MVLEIEPLQRIEDNYDTLTSAEKKAADYIMERSNAVIGENLTMIANNAGVSNAAVIRMSRKLGYEGFSDFRLSLNRYFMSSRQQNDEADQSSLAQTYCQTLSKVPEMVEQKQLRALAKKMWHTRYLDIWGINRTFQSVQQLSFRLSRLGVYNKPVNDMTVMQDDASIMKTGDMCIIFTVRGKGNLYYGELLDSMRRKGCYTVLVTCKKDLELIDRADEAFILPWATDIYKARFLEDQMAFYMFVEMLLMEVAKAGNEEREKEHPESKDIEHQGS